VTRSHKTAAAVEDHDADVYAGYLSDLSQELLEPPEFVLRDEVLQPRGSRRGRVIRDGVADWSEAVETAFPPDDGHGAVHRERRARD
jgi:hypothetical protein